MVSVLQESSRATMRQFTVLCVYYTVCIVTGTRQRFSRFIVYPSLDEIVSEEDKLGIIHSDSSIRCCAICKGNALCLSAFYSHDSKACTLYSQVFKASETGTTSEAGSKYYYSRLDLCQSVCLSLSLSVSVCLSVSLSLSLMTIY